MADAFLAERSALRAAAAEIATIHHDITSERDNLKTTIDQLLESGWSGTARNAYAAAWHEWCSGAKEVLEGLSDMARAVHATLADYEAQDAVSSHSLGRILPGETTSLNL